MAPRTTGIPFGKGLEQEMVKQLFDIGVLSDALQSPKVVAQSFQLIGKKEMGYRGMDIEISAILDDMIHTAIIIAKRDGNKEPQAQADYAEIVKGITRFRGFLISGIFRIEEAVLSAGKAAYLAILLKKEAYNEWQPYHKDALVPELIQEKEWAFLNKYRKLADPSTFFYWAKAIERMNL